MNPPSPRVAPLLPRQRTLLLGSLLVLAAAAWVVLLWQRGQMANSGMGLTMGMDAPLFLAIWVVMMVAMMFPTSAPMILMFARIQAGKRRQGNPYVPTWVFVSAYLLVWTCFGIFAYALAVGVERLTDHSTWVMAHAARAGGGVLLLAGLYQLSPWKQICLAKCRTPLAFVLGSWRDGRLGSFRMGLEHGFYCLGCCWLLFVILFPLGVMNIAIMALLTGAIFAEKSWALGSQASRVVAAGLAAYGIVVLLLPQALPTRM